MPVPDVDFFHLKHPPVVEVSLGIQFDPIERLNGLHVGLYWSERRLEFPKTEEHHPIAPEFEVFPRLRTREARPAFTIHDSPSVPRFWFLNETGSELIQIQQDRFIHNWRKLGNEDSYPSYGNVREIFVREVHGFRDFLQRESLGELTVNQCELAYVDHIVSGEHWTEHHELDAVFRWWSSAPVSEVERPEEIHVHQRHLIIGPDGKPCGRLHLSIEPAWRVTDGKPIFLFRQVARGMGDGTSIDDALAFLDLAHDFVIRTFAGSMTQSMLESWGERDHG